MEYLYLYISLRNLLITIGIGGIQCSTIYLENDQGLVKVLSAMNPESPRVVAPWAAESDRRHSPISLETYFLTGKSTSNNQRGRRWRPGGVGDPRQPEPKHGHN